MTRLRKCGRALAVWFAAPIDDVLALLRRADERRWILVGLYRDWYAPGRPWWRRAWWALRDWPHTVTCPACNGAGCRPCHPPAFDPCEWCDGATTWDLREDMPDEAWAMLARRSWRR